MMFRVWVYVLLERPEAELAKDSINSVLPRLISKLWWSTFHRTDYKIINYKIIPSAFRSNKLFRCLSFVKVDICRLGI